MAEAAEPVVLRRALLTMLLQPLQLAREWNWKAALFSAVLRGVLFFATNLHAGHDRALKAMLVELLYATLAAGFVGSVTQRLRHAVPRAATGAFIWLAMPTAMLVGQAAVHRVMGTPHVRAGLIASFIFAAFANGFNWFAMTRGAFVTGEGRSFTRDLQLVPRLIVQFVWAGIRRARVTVME